MAPHSIHYYDLLDALDQEIPYPEWMEADLYGDREPDREDFDQ